MSQCKDPQSCKSQLRGWSTMIFHTVIILQLTEINGGESPANSQHRMLAVIGHTESITLPCSINPATDVVDEMVEWSRSALNPRFVHVRRSGEDHLVDQNPSYKERTSMSVDGLKVGDVSLKLTKVRLSDEGTYRCFVPRLNTDFSVELVVEADIQITKVSPGVLECKSEGWYPEPEVLWLERERKLLSAGPKETFRGPDDLGTISSRLTLEKGHSNNFTCRIQQNNLQREATIYVPDDFFVKSSSSARSVIGLIAGIMFVSVVLFLVWKWRKNKMENKKSSEDGESQNSREDNRCENPEEESFIKKKSSLTKIKSQPEPLDSNFEIPNQSMMDNSRQQQQLDTHMKENTKKTKTINAETSSQNPSEEEVKQETEGKNNPEVQKKDKDGETTQTTNNETADQLDRNASQPSPAEGGQDNREEDSGPNPNTQASHLAENRTNQEHSGTTEQPTSEENQLENTSPTDEGSVAGNQQEHSTASTNATSGAGDQNNDTSGVTTQTTNNETADQLERNVSQPSPAEGGQDNREGDSGPNPNTQASHLEENRTNQEHSGTTEQPTSEENQLENTSPTGEGSVGGDQQERSTASTNATSGAGDQNNDTSGVTTQTTNNETADQLDRNASQPSSTKGGQDNREEDSRPNPNTQASHLEENRTNQEHPGTTELPTIEENQLENTSPTDEGSVAGDQQEHSTASTNATSGAGDQNNNTSGVTTQTTNNETADQLDRNVSQPSPAEGREAEEGQDNREEDRGGNRDTQPSHLEENGTIQAPSGRTEHPMTEENQPENTSATDDGSVVGEHSTESTDAKSGLKDQNNDGN